VSFALRVPVCRGAERVPAAAGVGSRSAVSPASAGCEGGRKGAGELGLENLQMENN